MITDDLSTLFGQTGPGVRFRQGTILEWDSESGANSVDLAGGTLTNVPILNTGEAIALKAGHVVGLLGQGTSWFIIGRVTPPGSPDFAGSSVAFDGAFALVQTFGITSSRVTKAVATLAVPSWADQALVWVTASAILGNVNASATLVDLYAGVDLSTGIAGRAPFAPLGAANYADTGTVVSHCQAVINNPGPTIACKADLQIVLGSNWASSANQYAGISATAIYRSTV